MIEMQESLGDHVQQWGSGGLQYVNEALEDSKRLQVLTGNLLGTLQGKYDEIRQTAEVEEDAFSEREISRRNIENLIVSLQNIQKDIDANIESFNNLPTKTFFQSNIEQLTAIYQLLFILPSLRPFIPDKSPNASVFDEQQKASSAGVNIKDQDALSVKQEGSDVKQVTCFDREPRSLSSLPPSRYIKSEHVIAEPLETLS